jgi:hypothetical protein
MLELLDVLNDPELAEVEPFPGSVLFFPTAASPPAAAAPPLAAAASPDYPPAPSPTATAAAAAPSAAPLAFFLVFYPKKAPEVAAAAAEPLVGAAAAATTTPALSQKAAAGAAAKNGLRVVLKMRNERVKSSTAAAAHKLEELHGRSKVLGEGALAGVPLHGTPHRSAHVQGRVDGPLPEHEHPRAHQPRCVHGISRRLVGASPRRV